MKVLYVIFVLSFLLVSVDLVFALDNDESALEPDPLELASDHLAVLETNQGQIVMEFFPNDAPNHVRNFITLAESGFYDGTLFHRIIPGFMIQGGDPNTIDGDPRTWGQGGPDTMVDAEFNTIKHNRGIVSMARASDPNSAGSQFFIVHSHSNFLDQNYTVFGRILTEESFETLDKIANIETIKPGDAPKDPEQVRINTIEIVKRSGFSDLLPLGSPDRVDKSPATIQNQRYENPELGVVFSAPPGWFLQQPERTNDDTPNVVAVGPKTGLINPVISLTVRDTDEMTFDEVVLEKNQTFKELTSSGVLEILSQERSTINDKDTLVTIVIGQFQANDEVLDVKFKEVLIYDFDKSYTLHYSNSLDDFDAQLPSFDESVGAFEILETEESSDSIVDDSSKSNDDAVDPPKETTPIDDSTESSMTETISKETTPIDDSTELSMSETIPEDESTDGGGCLIATAAFGTELAPQVQLLREIRDGKVLNTTSGTTFMTGFNQLYYSFSPTIADLQRQNPIFNETVKLVITPMLYSLSLLDYADTEHDIFSYGLAVIMLNIGMYIAAPAILVYKIVHPIRLTGIKSRRL